jgi:hypothetical protein
MPKLKVCDILHLPTCGQFVIAGKLIEGTIDPGMYARIGLGSVGWWKIRVVNVQFIERVDSNESLIGLVFEERNSEDAAMYESFCPIGSVLEVCDGE